MGGRAPSSFLRGESLANSVNVNKTGNTSTASGCHVTSKAVMAVVWARVAKRADVAYLLNIRILGPVAPLTRQYSRGGLN